MTGMEMQMPWEYHVCYNCLQSNWYAIWLVKQRCLEPHRHAQPKLVPVVIDQSNMALVAIRPLPQHYNQFRGQSVMCLHYPDCKGGSKCRLAHSEIEMDTWNIKKSLLNEYSDVCDSVGELCKLIKEFPPPIQVCQTCCEDALSASWLAKLCCLHPETHSRVPMVTVLCAPRSRQLVKVRPPPQVKFTKHLLRPGQKCDAGDGCTGAHSDEEYIYWTWKLITEFYKKLGTEYDRVYGKYKYPEESSPSLLHAVQAATTRHNYVSKYHKLVYLDELANSRKMTTECDGTVTIRASIYDQTAQITNMGSSAAMDYAHHNRAEIAICVDHRIYAATACDRDYEADALVIKVHSSSFQYSYMGTTLLDVKVHFDISHLYFHRLHEAVSYADNDDILDKLLPSKESFSTGPQPRLQVKNKPRYFRIDREYQLKALSQMLSCNPRAPYLILGPFGTGKSHILAAAVATLLSNNSNKVLICTHLNRGADGLYKTLQIHMGYEYTRAKVVRLVPNQEALEQLRLRPPYSALAVRDTTVSQLARFPVTLSTFVTAMHIRTMEDKGGMTLQFTHILIDEGAQSREPEALGALSLADRSTRVVIVGDNKQVGPQVEVLSNAARENGLGTSILERLFTHYKELKGNKAPPSHVSTLLTNYRCHPSILMLASSLYYEFTLLSRSKSPAHPKAPYPIVFACSSVENQDFRNLPAVNEEEATTLIARMVEFIQDWPSDGPIPTFGLLASTRQQVACLRKKFYRIKRTRNFRCKVEILPTYNIQGEEFDAVFLSTAEPTNDNGEPPSPSKSVCNDYVFNTVLTRARSLVYSIGNPFLLQHKGKHFKVNCWQEYIRRCIQCQTLILPHVSSEEAARGMPRLVDQLSSRVFLSESLEQATTVELGEEDFDIIVDQYIEDLQKRREYRVSHKLVQGPQGEMRWDEVKEESDAEGEVEPPEGTVVWCTLDCKNHRLAKAIPNDPSQPPIEIHSLHARRLAFHGDVVKIDVLKQCVLLDGETEKAICTTHFGKAFLCRVDPHNPVLFFPLDKRHPKFVNLPTLTHREKEGVVCFDPNSINSSPKVSNFIPIECAVNMLFIVKFLGWWKKYPYPLGIIVGAMPPGNSLSTGDMILRISHGIPLTPPQLPPSYPQLRPPTRGERVFEDAFTIDPEGSTDHDDALTCRLVSRALNGNTEYEIGVHITDLSKYVPKGSDVDEIAFQRGCSVYRSPDQCISMMLPSEITEATSLSKGKITDTFSVLARVLISQETTVLRLYNCEITESQVTSALELTYQQAQSIIFSQVKNQDLRDRLLRYDHSQPTSTLSLAIKTKIKILWNVAFFLRQQRLGTGAGSFLISDAKKEECPEAHILVEEFMVWANQEVAKKLLHFFPESTILRRQGRPSAEQLEVLLKYSGHNLSLSPALKCYVPDGTVPPTTILLLEETLRQIHQNARSDTANGIVNALHLIQHEHLHPQLATAHESFRRIAQSSAEYCISTPHQRDYWHDTLKCSQYTHFTSPVRRYVDVVIQRFLHAAIHHHSPPHTHVELDRIVLHVKECLRKGNSYEREIKKLALAHDLLQSSREFLSFVVEVKEGKMYIKFRDLSLKIFNAEELVVHLKNLNAFDISPQKKSVNASMPGRQPCHRGSSYQSPDRPVQLFTWRVKVASLTGVAQSFLRHPNLKYTSQPSADRKAEIILFVPDREGEMKSLDWNQEAPLLASIQPFTCPVPLSVWHDVQECLKQNPANPDTRAASHALQKLSTPAASSASSAQRPACTSSTLCPLWIYKLQRPIHQCEVLQVQLATNHQSSIISPCIQLLEVGPGLHVCVQHNASPAECFTDKPTENASKKEYHGIVEYFQRWEQVLLAEGAFSSLVDAEFLLLKDVQLKWPPLTQQVASDGQLYYQLLLPKHTNNSGVQLELPTHFEESSLNFFSFSEGDLVCIRYEHTDKNTSGDLHHVFHMVVKYVDYTSKPVTIYLKFVGKSSNYIPATMERALRTPSLLRCEIQLIHLSLPFRRVYRSLCQLTGGQATQMARTIALGAAKMSNSSFAPVETVIPVEAASKATSLWPIRRRTRGSGRQKLNRFQKEAIQLACNSNNKFVMIQGPPGTGKSVTGAHLAYALAVKLRKERERFRGDQCEGGKVLRPCVMYCGPSQQSVNVVLDMFTKESSVHSELKIVRVYSKAVERKDFAGSKHNTELFRQERTDAKCDPKYRDYALHYLIRKRNPKIRGMDELFKQLDSTNTIPSQEKRAKYRAMMMSTEVEVLKDNVDIILCTCNEASSHRVMESLRPVYCIVDECAMATEPECMVPIRRAEHVILIGDHQQLQPVIKYRVAAEMGLSRSLFERYVKYIGREPHMLRRQYRMHMEICRFPSLEFYDGKLQTDYSLKARKNKEAHLSNFWPRSKWKPFVFCDVVGTEGESHTGQKSKARVGVESKYNEREAVKIAQIAKTLVTVHGVSPQAIAAITPYSAQREEIRKQLQTQAVTGVLVKTITESQGSEYGIVLMSMVRSKPIAVITTPNGKIKKADMGWLRENLGFITDRHQICVGITRCKYGLVIVGNKQLLSYDATWSRLIEHYRRNGCVRNETNFP